METSLYGISIYYLRSYVVVLLKAFWLNERFIKLNFKDVLLFIERLVLTKLLVDKIIQGEYKVFP
jgi:hypothetical protein